MSACGQRADSCACAPRLFDMHCHLDFASDVRTAACEATAAGIAAFSTTVTPDEYVRARDALEGCACVRVGVGLHPWWVADGTCEPSAVERFEHLVAQTRYVGEIGLDFAPRREDSREVQVDVFRRAIAACARGGKLVSIHAVRAAREVLDVLEDTHATCDNACVLHWFSGTSDELHRAAKLGCFFSVNPRMLESKRGRAYVQAMPLERLLLETDAPSAAGMPYDASAVAAALDDTLDALATLRHADCDELAVRIASTSKTLLFG